MNEWMNGHCVYCTVYSFQIYLCNITVLQPLLLLGPLSIPRLNDHSIISYLLLLLNSVTPLWAPKLPLLHSHQHNPLPPSSSLQSLLLPISLVLLSVLSLLLSLQCTVMKHFSKEVGHLSVTSASWCTTLTVLAQNVPTLFFFFLLQREIFQEPCRSASLQMHAYLLQLFGNSLKNVYLNNFLKRKKNLFTFSHQLFT